MSDDNIVQFGPQGVRTGTGGNGSGSGGASDLKERLAKIEATLPFLATKTDVTNLKVWILGGVLSAVSGAGLVSWIIDVISSRSG